MRRADERGAAAVEMALVLPLLLFILFGIIDYGRLLNAQLTLTEAAREGARAAALGQSADSRVQSAAGGLGTVTTTVVTACPATPGPTDDAVVQTELSFRFVTPVAAIAVLFKGDLDGTVVVRGKGVMPCQG